MSVVERGVDGFEGARDAGPPAGRGRSALIYIYIAFDRSLLRSSKLDGVVDKLSPATREWDDCVLARGGLWD